MIRHTASVTSVSWIPSEAIDGVMRLPMSFGISHYDDPPPDRIEDLEALRRADGFRFANHLAGWIAVDRRGSIVEAGYSGGGLVGATILRLGGSSVTIPAVPFPDLRSDPVIENDRAVFTQTAGGRTGAPMPRRVNRAPYLQVAAPTAWTTLRLVIAVDGTSTFELTGASPFPRHWIYDQEGRLAAKSGITDYRTWAREAFVDDTPWDAADSPAVVTEVETALERELSRQIMREGDRPAIRRLSAGSVLTRQGDRDEEMILVLDGVVAVEADGALLTELGPGAVVGERAVLEGGIRTATLTAVTAVKLAVVPHQRIDEEKLRRLAEGRHREQLPLSTDPGHGQRGSPLALDG